LMVSAICIASMQRLGYAPFQKKKMNIDGIVFCHLFISDFGFLTPPK
jgi:hypothetical protein